VNHNGEIVFDGAVGVFWVQIWVNHLTLTHTVSTF